MRRSTTRRTIRRCRRPSTRYPVRGYPAGYPGYQPYDPYRPTKPPGTNGKAIAALVTSLAGLMFCGLPSIVGLILGIIAMRESKRTGQDGYGIALAGTIIGGVLTALLVLYLVLVDRRGRQRMPVGAIDFRS